MPRLNHNKKRNVGLVYELLAREVAQAAIDRSGSSARRAAESLDIIGEHLGKGSVLSQELALHQGIMEARGSSAALARRMVDELRAAGLRLSGLPGRDSAKTALIHEINRRVGPEVFDNRVPDYTVHASVGIVLSRGIGRLDEGIELARVEEHLVSFLTAEAPTPRALDPEATLHTYQTAVGLFEQEYGELTPDMAALLRENVRVALGGPREPLERLVAKQKAALRRELSAALVYEEAIKADEKMRESLKEAWSALDSVPATEEGVEQLMLYHNLVKEIESK